MTTPQGIPARCKRAWRILGGEFDPGHYIASHGWYCEREIVRLDDDHVATGRKTRELVNMGFLDWTYRPAPAGGKWVYFRRAANPGHGEFIDTGYRPAGGKGVAPSPSHEEAAHPPGSHPRATSQPGLYSDSTTQPSQVGTVAPAQADLFHVEPLKPTLHDFETAKGRPTR